MHLDGTLHLISPQYQRQEHVPASRSTSITLLLGCRTQACISEEGWMVFWCAQNLPSVSFPSMNGVITCPSDKAVKVAARCSAHLAITQCQRASRSSMIASSQSSLITWFKLSVTLLVSWPY